MLKNNDLSLTTRVSGKGWKRSRKSTNSLKTTVHRSTFEEKQKLKETRRAEVQKRKEEKESLAQMKKEKRERMEESAKRRLENQRKGEVVVEIKNTAKLKRMKKSQLRNIVQRDLQ